MTAPEADPAGRPFAIVGAGGHGREVLDIAVSCGLRHLVAGFVDDGDPEGEARDRIRRLGATVIGPVASLANSGLDFTIAIGSCTARRRIDETISDLAAPPRSPVLCHATSSIGSDTTLGPGVVVGAMSTITTNVRIGRHSHINVGCAVQHDSSIGDYVTLSPGVFVNGDVTIGDDVFLGTGAIVTRGCSIGSGATIGAGAVVLADVAAGALIVGVPGRPTPPRGAAPGRTFGTPGV